MEASFWQDMAALNVDPPDIVLRVSEHVPEILSYIQVGLGWHLCIPPAGGISAPAYTCGQRILDRGHGYISPADGSVYFDSVAFGLERYGKLHVQGDAAAAASIASLEAGAEGAKRHAFDFALWKRCGANGFDSPYGYGRPGWCVLRLW
jgi:cysteinyl-tRNA synthetase